MTRTRTRGLLITVLLLGGVALGGSGASAAGDAIERPLQVRLDFVGVEPDFECDSGLMPQGADGTGHLSHLGKVEISGGQCNDFATLSFTDGFGTYVSANGDAIEVEYSGQATLTPQGFDGDGTAVIVGGTGRFEAASGEFDFAFTTTVSADGSRTLLDGDGWIRYDASNRRRA